MMGFALLNPSYGHFAMRVVLVSFRDLGRGGDKMSPGFFIPIFGRVLRQSGIELGACWADELRRSPERHRGQIVILVYREVWAQVNGEFGARVERTEAIARANDIAVLHGIELGRLVADKTRTNRALAAAGIAVPQLATGRAADFPVFSNDNCATQAAVSVHGPDAELDPQRYNAAYIDTTHDYRGKAYHVCLRAMAVGGECVSVYVRARAASEGDPSVHAKDTPLDAGLLNHLYETIVAPRREAIADLCRAIGETLGLAFCAHDILPCNASEKLYVCESNFKFDDPTIRSHLKPLGDSIPFNDHVAAAVRSSHAFIGEARKAGYF